jgi:hypothetical protein
VGFLGAFGARPGRCWDRELSRRRSSPCGRLHAPSSRYAAFRIRGGGCPGLCLATPVPPFSPMGGGRQRVWPSRCVCEHREHQRGRDIRWPARRLGLRLGSVWCCLWPAAATDLHGPPAVACQPCGMGDSRYCERGSRLGFGRIPGRRDGSNYRLHRPAFPVLVNGRTGCDGRGVWCHRRSHHGRSIGQTVASAQASERRQRGGGEGNTARKDSRCSPSS